MTNGWIDIKNTDMMLIMGGNPAENHPCGFKWPVEARLERNAKLIVVDPRLTRTAANADLLGFYHSHPDHPARPSQYDLDHALPFFSYVIISVTSATLGDVRSWRLRDDRSAFDEEILVNLQSSIVNP